MGWFPIAFPASANPARGYFKINDTILKPAKGDLAAITRRLSDKTPTAQPGPSFPEDRSTIDVVIGIRDAMPHGQKH
jgi:hypothetical protein